MALTESDLVSLSRPELLKLTKLIATLRNTTAKKLALELVPPDTKGLPDDEKQDIEEFGRRGIPEIFRRKLAGVYSELTPLMQAALAETVGRATGADLSTDWQSELRRIAPGLDLRQFNDDWFSQLDDTPELHFLLLRLHRAPANDDDFAEFRLAYMTIRKNPEAPAMPLFETVRRQRLLELKTVRGIVLKSGTTLYTVGQLDGIAGLRFTRLIETRSRVLRDDLTEEEPHIKLSGVRLGFHDDRRRPFAHLMIARQIPSDSEYANRELWLKNPRGIYRSNEQPLKDAIYEIRDIAKGLQHEATVEGLLPPFDD